MPNESGPPRSDAHESARNGDDLSLAGAVSSGSIPAWHDFLQRYSDLIFSVVRRHLIAEDEDDVSAVYVDILEALYTGELAKYRGDVKLTTWLIVFTRSRSLDYFRKHHGRYRVPEGYDRLNEFDRQVLKLFFIKRLPLAVVLHVLHSAGFKARLDDVVDSACRIRDVMDGRYLNRVDRQYDANRYGVDSARMLAYLLELETEHEEKMRSNRPDEQIIEKEARVTVERVQALVASLSARDREVLELRFTRNLSAKEIAERLHLEGQRKAYTLIDSIVRKLRKAMDMDRQL
jgi:RNA polymerase sigma factor (sigma-70 family)